MKQQFPVRIIIVLALGFGVFGCASQPHLPAPVPPPLTGHALAEPLPVVWSASIDALRNLGYSNIDADETRSILVTDVKQLEGNTAHNRNSGIARFVLERDIYSEGQSRLRITLADGKARGQTEIRMVPELKGKVEERGDIKYATYNPANEEDSGDENQSVGVWETLSSNGVLEDRFLAALIDLLHSDKIGRQGGSLPDHSRP